MRFERISPITGRAASSAIAMTAAEAGAVADRAGAAFRAWADMGPNARRAILSDHVNRMQSPRVPGCSAAASATP